MSKNRKRNRKAPTTRNPAKNSVAAPNSSTEVSANTPPRGPESDPAQSAAPELSPVRPDPEQGFQPLGRYLLDKIVKEVMRQMKYLAQEWHIPLDPGYWERITHKILGQSTPDDALIIPAPAGSGKSTWILALLLALKTLFQSDPELEDSLVGVAVIRQKVEDLNELDKELNKDCSDGKRFMVPLQSWTPSGQGRNFCLAPGVDSYTDCQGSRCPYADQCPLQAFREEAPYAPVVGLTQARFDMLRQGDLSSVFERYTKDGARHPRRYIIFDEKYRMAQVEALNAEQINEASTQFTDLIQKIDASDTRVRSLQMRLDYSVRRPFQAIRKRMRTETGDGTHDIPVGFLTLTEEEQETAEEYRMLREIIGKEPKRLMSKPLSATLKVMDHLYDGNACLFTKTNGFCVYRHYPPQLHFGACQTLMFDATAEVDNDYRDLPNVQMLSGTPKASPRCVVFHLHTHQDLNVSKRAMRKSWKLPAFTEYIASLIEATDRPVFLCTYKIYAVELAAKLRERLAPEDMSKVLLMPDREVPTTPYFNGTNGSNDFKDAETVIILGYPRLDPSTYLSVTCSACGQKVLAAELDAIPEEKLLSKDFNGLELPSVRDYVAHHLAARLEQEIYRCAQRNPGFTGEINIHLFCPPADMLSVLLGRISGKVDKDPELPGCVERCKGTARRYKGSSTSFGRLVQFLETWDGLPLHPSEIQKQAGISPSTWKDLMTDPRVKDLQEEYRVQRTGRGPNAKWQIPRELCA